MITNNSLKEYYVKLQELYNNAVNILTAINQSLSTSASEITVNVTNSDDTVSKIRIPSFLYLEDKLEQLDNNFNNLFSMPSSGEAWFKKSQDMFKLNLVRSNTSPLTPEFSKNDIFASITDNNFLKDLVSPKTFLKIFIDNLPDNVDEMFMKKIVIFNKDMFDALTNLNLKTYEEYKAALYNFTAGKDYEEYDSVLKMPIRLDVYKSRFEILELPQVIEGGNQNPWIDPSNSNLRKLSYKVRLNTLEYTDQEDTSIVFTLKVGDYICLGNRMVVYKVKNVNTSDMTVIIEESVGHCSLQTIEENAEMAFEIYNSDYSKYHYIQVPLEENQYICVFLGTIMNNVRSILSDAYLVDLSTIYIRDKGNNYILDEFGNRMSYMDYYEKYCINIGDLILGLTEAAYPQLSNYPANVLEELQNSAIVKALVDATWDNENVLQVVPINKHLTDDVTSDEIINLHAQKNDINSQLSTVQDNINTVYNTLLNTDFSKEISITHQSLQTQLQQYYTERTTLQKQLNAIVDNINSKQMDLKVISTDVKYRIRGITIIDNLEKYIHEHANAKCDVIGLEVEYKYKSPTKDTDNITVINSSTFTDWNRLDNIDRQRKLVFNTNTNAWMLDYVNYATTDNIIKWNQIDIPIKQGEDVIVRIRYKFNIGQPFVNIYTPWSDELLMIFPQEYKDDVELDTILTQNKRDTVTSAFSKTLIDEGYAEHVQNNLITMDQKFFHMPENIYSGFNTAENNLISLKDKLLSMNNYIETYRTLLDNESNAKFEVYLTYDDYQVPLSKNTKNVINIYNSDHIADSFIKKKMNIVIKNTGDVRVNLYSIFPGNTDTLLIDSNMQFYNDRIGNYERVPVFMNNNLTGQYLGQWIYFRKNNPYTGESIYFESAVQDRLDYNCLLNYSPFIFTFDATNYMPKNNKQVLLGNRRRNSSLLNTDDCRIYWKGIQKDSTGELSLLSPEHSMLSLEEMYLNLKNVNKDWYKYKVSDNNYYLMKYEEIAGHHASSTSNTLVYLDESTNFTTFKDNYSPANFSSDSQNRDFIGAFLYVDIISKEQVLTEGDEKDSVFLEVGESKAIPIVFEYYVDSTTSSISKSLYFDIRNSLIRDPYHYMVEIVGNYDYTASGDIYSNISQDITGGSAAAEENS